MSGLFSSCFGGSDSARSPLLRPEGSSTNIFCSAPALGAFGLFCCGVGVTGLGYTYLASAALGASKVPMCMSATECYAAFAGPTACGCIACSSSVAKCKA